MATIFWDIEGVLLIEYMQKGTTINAETYGNTLKRLRKAIDKKRPNLSQSNVLLLHDNATVHKAAKVRPILTDCDFTELDHPPYSPDMAPSDYYLFRKLKKFLRGRRFETDEHLKQIIEQYFNTQEKTLFSSGIGPLPDKWRKCVNVADYI